MTRAMLLKLMLLMILLTVVGARAVAAEPATRGSKGDVWSPKWFSYERPKALIVEESTPTAAQVDWHGRPPQMGEDLAPPVANLRRPEPRVVGNMDLLRLRFRDVDGQDVPALLCTPHGKKGPFPVAVALHGITSNKAQVIAQVGPSLTKRGFAVLAIDMPMHGERPGEPRKLLDKSNLAEFFSRCRECVVEARQAIDLAEERPELDTSRGVVLVGYSMGALMNSIIGPVDSRVKAMVLMVGGTPEFPAALGLIPQLAALQPQLAIPNFSGRPLLMLNGTSDLTITKEMGLRLFNAAAQPKKQIWYESGHLLPNKAYEDAAEWVAETWKKLPAAQ